MRKLRTWLIGQFEKLLLMPDYFRALAKEWLNILFGETLVGIGFLIWWALGAPTNHALIVVFVIAMFVAGYYAWRSDHARLIPQLEVLDYRLQETPTNQPGLRKVYVQLSPKCRTESPVRECRGHLLRVYKRFTENEQWTETVMNEPLSLEWGHSGYGPIDLYPQAERNLNVCCRDNRNQIIQPTVDPLPLRWFEAFNAVGTFRFDIRITAKECAPVDVSVAVSIDECEWNKPKVSIL
jgi:hypothetical protein